MSRYRGPRLRITRRLGRPPRSHPEGRKAVLSPGRYGQARRKRSEYAIRLEEKQSFASTTACLNANSCATKKARAQDGSTGTNLLKLLENRLDNVCFRLGFGLTRAWRPPAGEPATSP